MTIDIFKRSLQDPGKDMYFTRKIKNSVYARIGISFFYDIMVFMEPIILITILIL